MRLKSGAPLKAARLHEKYRATHPEAVERQKERRKKYVAENRDHVNAVKREWYRRNRYRISAKNRERYASDPEYRAKLLAGCRVDYYKHHEERLEARREYWKRYKA